MWVYGVPVACIRVFAMQNWRVFHFLSWSEEESMLLSMEHEAADRFPPGKTYGSMQELKSSLSAFGEREVFLW
jgi:hypothetical protein